MESKLFTAMTGAIYARYTTNQQFETSIDFHHRVCLEFAERHGVKIHECDLYHDKVTTGQVASRQGFDELLQKVKLGYFNTIIVYDYQMLFRSDIQGRIFEKTCRNENVRIISVIDHIDTFDKCIDKYLSMMGCLYSVNHVNARKEAIERHNYLLSKNHIFWRIYGYRLIRKADNDPDSELHPDNSLIVREIFQLYDEGHSTQQISDFLNKKNVPTHSKRAKWHKSVLLRCLKNENYIGVFYYRKNRYVCDTVTGKKLSKPNDIDKIVRIHRPDLRIISDKLWEKVQLRLLGTSNTHSKNKP